MNSRTLGVSLLLFGSGLCALVYQTVWLREFRLIFGASTAATAAVLGIFMGGIGIGSVLFGRWSEKAKSPLKMYSNLEFGIAIATAATPFLVTLVRWFYGILGGSLALGPIPGTCVRLGLSALVLAAPTLLMGGTLPAAARSVVGAGDAGRRGLAWLYGTNTLGAVTGVVLATFFALEALGNRQTLWVTCILNLIVAALARRMAGNNVDPADAPAREMAEPPTPSHDSAVVESAPPAPGFVLVASAVVGFAFLLMELVWYRMLSPLLGGSTFTFGLILAGALLGIGLGGLLYALAGHRTGGTLSVFAWTCALEALCVAAPFALGDRLAILAAHLRSLSAVGFGAEVFGWALIVAVVVLPAAVVSGFQFPLLVALLGRGPRKVGRHVANAYAWNTLGAIAGSLAGGFGLLPALTAPGAWQLVVFTLAALALAALVMTPRVVHPSPTGGNIHALFSRLGALGTATLAALLMLGTLGPTAVWRHSGVGVGRSKLDASTVNSTRQVENKWRRHLLWEADGVESSVAIVALHGASFIVNGKSDGNVRADAGTQVMGGLIGAALQGDVHRACVIGLGTGCTAGWLGKVPEIERVDVMELEPAIQQVARVCEVANQHVLDNPKCRLLTGDAREMLLTSRDQYDLIFSEPSNPYRAGIASLFTTEFYEAARARLHPDGLFLQWVQAYEVDAEAIRMVVSTMAGAFPHVEMWITQTGDLLLVASPEPRTWNLAALRTRLAQEPFRTAARRIWGVDSAEGMLAHFACAPEVARRLAALPGEPRNTDDNMLLEFAFARSVGRTGGFNTMDLLPVAQKIGASRPALTGEPDWSRVAEERLAMYAYDHVAVPPPPPVASAATRVRCEIRRLVLENSFPAAAQLWLQEKPEPLNPRDTLTFARALAETGTEEARPLIDQVGADSPGEAATLTAILAARKGHAAEALTDHDPASIEPLSAALHVGPFPGCLMESVRRTMLSRLTLREWRTGQKIDASGYAFYDAWPEWTGDFLTDRYAFARATGLGDARLAHNQLVEFLAAEPAPFARELQSASREAASPLSSAPAHHVATQ
ncbi:MAG: fused MFS/spermidine synthase [Chthoniobacter sp.]|nr:fused MFS/spermidine synthase [Chthoniobacter sp.]